MITKAVLVNNYVDHDRLQSNFVNSEFFVPAFMQHCFQDAKHSDFVVNTYFLGGLF